jgi:hypothetical protein
MIKLQTIVPNMAKLQESLHSQNEALSSIRQRMSSPDRAATESTIGAILLLAGIVVLPPCGAVLDVAFQAGPL